ncbi:MAG TPA: 16S rRNA (adenine(1518)-N(6)/adenine(1519)-N(6))-dimethyltransferase RsmA [Saprospiraceae bacterium]|nr:16S rRNA (adenine(1518)-N(6)/adenine(1519)-N(6))-dimethyltransferase RsmA [Saprospiraceae bacterium]
MTTENVTHDNLWPTKANKNKVKAKKSYGQHFLTNEQTSKKIAYSLLRKDGNTKVLEVGPGKGMLTKYLIEQNLDLKVVEADNDMVVYLSNHYPKLIPNIIEMDFIKANMHKVFDDAQFYIIGNFPYNISSQIVFKAINAKELVPEMVGMFQKEMAERIIAKPGSKIYGVISVLTQAHYDGEMLYRIPPGAFNPPPKVDSAVIRLIRKEKYTLDCNEKLFRTVVKMAFNSRRKMMRNTLKALVEDPSVLAGDFFNLRPEQVSVQQFVELTNELEKYVIK